MNELITIKKEVNWNIRYPLDILSNNGITEKVKLVALVLFTIAHGKSNINISAQEISTITGIKVITIYASLKKLEELGFISINRKVSNIKNKKTYVLKYGKFQMIPQWIYDKFISSNPNIIIKYANLRYANWWCTYKDGTMTNDTFKIVDTLGFKKESQYRDLLNELTDAGLITAKMQITFFDGLDDETLQPITDIKPKVIEQPIIQPENDNTQLITLINELKDTIKELANQISDKDKIIKELTNKQQIEQPIIEDSISDLVLNPVVELTTKQSNKRKEIMRTIQNDFIGYGTKVNSSGFQEWDISSIGCKRYDEFKKYKDELFKSIVAWMNYEKETGDTILLNKQVIQPLLEISRCLDCVFDDSWISIIKNMKSKPTALKFINDKLSNISTNGYKHYEIEKYRKVTDVIKYHYNAI